MSLVTAKTKVSKLNPPTVPRLELCGAALLARLLLSVGDTLNIPSSNWQAWSDSAIVLAWLDGNPRQHPVFVANRVAAILRITPPSIWHYVPTSCNPADCASRGLMPTALLNHALWWEGPTWLKEEPPPLPKQPPRKPLPDAGLPICTLQQTISTAEHLVSLPLKYPNLIPGTGDSSLDSNMEDQTLIPGPDTSLGLREEKQNSGCSKKLKQDSSTETFLFSRRTSHYPSPAG